MPLDVSLLKILGMQKDILFYTEGYSNVKYKKYDMDIFVI